jgi:small subunit ribosomal protein S21
LQVFVRDNNVDQALRVLKKKMQREGLFREMKRRRFYEKPSEKAAREEADAIRRARKAARKKGPMGRTCCRSEKEGAAQQDCTAAIWGEQTPAACRDLEMTIEVEHGNRSSVTPAARAGVRIKPKQDSASIPGRGGATPGNPASRVRGSA